jgi:hypothetical protein
MAETSLIRQNVAAVDAMMASRSVLVDVVAAALDGGWGGGTGTLPGKKEYIYLGGGTSDTNPTKIQLKERPWPVVLIKRILSKDEQDIDVILLGITELKV